MCVHSCVCVLYLCYLYKAKLIGVTSEENPQKFLVLFQKFSFTYLLDRLAGRKRGENYTFINKVEIVYIVKL